MYHLVGVTQPSTPAVTRRLTVDPTDFRSQLEWLVGHGYHSITQRQLLAALAGGRALPRRPIMITFDDGYSDVFFYASPVLWRLGMRATAYVISGRTSAGDPDFRSWTLLHALERRGIEIGSHTASHVDLTHLSEGQAREELARSRRTLEQRLGHPVRWLAYPFGAFDAHVEELARQAGYLLAVTTLPGTTQSTARPLALHRLRISDTTGVSGLAAMLAGGS